MADGQKSTAAAPPPPPQVNGILSMKNLTSSTIRNEKVRHHLPGKGRASCSCSTAAGHTRTRAHTWGLRRVRLPRCRMAGPLAPYFSFFCSRNLFCFPTPHAHVPSTHALQPGAFVAWPSSGPPVQQLWRNSTCCTATPTLLDSPGLVKCLCFTLQQIFYSIGRRVHESERNNHGKGPPNSPGGGHPPPQPCTCPCGDSNRSAFLLCLIYVSR